MNRNKLSNLGPIPVAVIGIVLCLLAVGLITYFMIIPTGQRIAGAQTRLDAAAPGATPAEREAGLTAANKKAQNDLKLANAQVAQVQRDWAGTESRLMPPFDVSNRRLAWRELVNELDFKLGPDLEHWLASTGVVPLVTVSIAAPPNNPNDPKLSGAPLAIPIGTSAIASGASGGTSSSGPSSGGASGGGTIAVGGDLRSILNHVLKWNDFNRLVLIDGLALHGNSPYMQGTYTGTVYIFPQNDTKPDKPIAEAGSGAAAGGAGGPGMRPGIRPGGP